MRVFQILLTLFLALFLFTGCSSSEEKQEANGFVTKAGSTVLSKTIKYTSNGKSMNGFLAIPEGEGPFPGILVVHEWWGQTDYPRERAIQLAKEGYMAFAVDMYGDGKTAKHPKDAKVFAKKVMEDMDVAEESFREALATLKKQEQVDPNNIGAMGYCFGGAIVLEMARRNLDLKIVASYHGDLTPLVKNPVSQMKPKVLIFNGAADTFVPREAVKTVRTKLKAGGVKYKFFNYKGAKHGFTNPEATKNGEEYKIPLAYNQRADEASWAETMKTFSAVFK